MVILPLYKIEWPENEEITIQNKDYASKIQIHANKTIANKTCDRDVIWRYSDVFMMSLWSHFDFMMVVCHHFIIKSFE